MYRRSKTEQLKTEIKELTNDLILYFMRIFEDT